MCYCTTMSSGSVSTRFHRAVELIGGRWNGPILYAILDGRRRYGEIRSAVSDLSDTMLSHRLKDLESEGLLERRVISSSPVAVEYHPTDKARALGPVLKAIGEWADRWIEPAAPMAFEETAKQRSTRRPLKFPTRPQ
jgi:DNA-binding HxlR family transcriptional regulator